MNYIALINKLWDSQDSNLFNCTEIALYSYLLNVGNRSHWPDSFKRLNARVMVDLGISFKTLSKARNRLKQAGFIDFKSVNGSKDVTYTFEKLSKIKGKKDKTIGNIPQVSAKVSAEVGGEVSAEVRDEVSNHTLYKKINIKHSTTTVESENLELKFKDKDYAKKITALFNEKCISLKPVKIVSAKRVETIMARFREHGEDAIFKVIENASQSKFLAGQSGGDWVADFDWIFKPTNFIKTYEDKYNRDLQQNKPKSNDRLEYGSDYNDGF